MMHITRRPLQRTCVPLIALALFTLVALAEQADVFLKDGRRLRGDVTQTADEVLIRTAAGELRFPRSQVDRIVQLAPASTQPAARSGPSNEALNDEYRRRFSALDPDDIDGHFGLAEWARERGRWDLVAKQCKYILGLKSDHRNAELLLKIAEERLAQGANAAAAEAITGAGAGEERKTIPMVPLLSDRDINRLKLYELPRDGEPEKVRVSFKRKAGQKTVIELATEEIANQKDVDPALKRKLEHGKPHEQLQIILRETDMKYADRIDLAGDTPTFEAFRKRVMPLIVSGCARSGCHTGEAASVFRLPGSSAPRDEATYTTFVLIDRIQTKHGPLIDREDPTASILLDYLIPAGDTDKPHPQTRTKMPPAPLKGRKDKGYDALVDWINSLRTPHPKYDLEYKFPDWLPEPPSAAPPEEMSTTEPSTTQPARER